MKRQGFFNLAAFMFAACVASSASYAHAGQIWTESGDAGDLPSSAQVTSGAGALDAITGTLNELDEIDIFAIMIPDLSLFSATTVGLGTEFIDTQLFLFDSSGKGVAANDDDADFFETNATIPAGSVTGPAGLYYLAVAEFGDMPISISGEIFPDLFSLTGEVFGPTGPGGGNPLSGWNLDGFSESEFPPFPSAYQITLTGATPAVTVPEPSTFALLCIGSICVVMVARKKTHQTKGIPAVD